MWLKALFKDQIRILTLLAKRSAKELRDELQVCLQKEQAKYVVENIVALGFKRE